MHLDVTAEQRKALVEQATWQGYFFISGSSMSATLSCDEIRWLS